jgi:hypothetical protein
MLQVFSDQNIKHVMSPEDRIADDRMDIYKNVKPAIMSICHLNFGAWHFVLNLVRKILNEQKETEILEGRFKKILGEGKLTLSNQYKNISKLPDA